MSRLEKRKRGKKKLQEVFLEKPTVDRGHRTDALLINELIGAPVIGLFHNVRPFPFGFKFSFTLARENNRTLQDQY